MKNIFIFKILSQLDAWKPKMDSPSTANPFYAVYAPQEPSSSYIYQDKIKALKVIKSIKNGSRLKQFSNRESAENYALKGESETNETKAVCDYNERPLPFKGPRSTELVNFRKVIEAGDFEGVQQLIECNPRYLVSSGDTPSVLQEGCRYNALHVVARCGHTAIASYILGCIRSVGFLKRLYIDSDEDSCQMRSDVLLDMYLNTPDKASHDTPLHFAAKHGHVEMVRLLVSIPACQRNIKNRFDCTPMDLICTRKSTADEEALERLKNEIKALLKDEQFFLPVLRSDDCCIQPKVGLPFSPTSPLTEETIIKETLFDKSVNGVLSPRVEIQALAGPFLGKSQAEAFRRRWKWAGSPKSALFDPIKGLEKLGRSLAHELNVPWGEYWAFLGKFIDLGSAEGLETLEKYLQRRFDETAFGTGKNEVLSPISELCEAFKACTLENVCKLQPKRLRFPSFKKRKIFSPDDSNYINCASSPARIVEVSAQIFARHIADILQTNLQDNMRSLQNFLKPQAKQLRNLVNGCLADRRLNGTDTLESAKKIHSRVVQLALEGLQEDYKDLLKKIKDIDEDDYEEGQQRFLNKDDVLKSHLKCLTNQLVNFNGITECNCLWEIFEENLETDPLTNSDSDDDFLTPPSSPVMSRKEEEDGCLDDSICLPDTFIYPGDEPTEMDLAVLEAISHVLVTPESYPSIYRWRHLLLLRLDQEPRVMDTNQVKSPSVVKEPSPKHWEYLTGPFTPKRKQEDPLRSPLTRKLNFRSSPFCVR